MDFPNDVVTPTHLNSFSTLMSGKTVRMLTGGSTPASFAWPAANLAAFIPFWVPWPYRVRRAFWVNGSTATGNVDVGVYSMGGARLWSTGSTAQSGASAVQYSAASNVILSPGKYYVAIAFSGTTNAAFGLATALTANLGRLAGLREQTAALPLPLNATPAAWARVGYPICGLTRLAAGF